jgi:phytoene/squalene synthetase
MAATVTITCACGCGRKKQVRTADVKRDWGKFFSKSCKARSQEKRTKQYATYVHNRQCDDFERQMYGGLTQREYDECSAAIEDGWDGHKNVR